jgi:acyl-coenzyme A thioesterase PaaI-like protein
MVPPRVRDHAGVATHDESSVPDRQLAGMADLGVPAVEQTAELAERRAAVADLGAAVRELMARTVGAEVPVDVLRSIAQDARALADELATVQRPLDRPSSVDDLRRGQRFFNPVVGPGNPLAPPMRVELVEGAAIGTVTLGLPYEGPFTFVHGGVSALLLDQIMGYATASAGHPGVTGRLQVRYRGAVPLGVPLRLRAAVIDVLGARVKVHATLAVAAEPDVALVEAEGRFMLLRQEQAVRLFGRNPGAVQRAVGGSTGEPTGGPATDGGAGG